MTIMTAMPTALAMGMVVVVAVVAEVVGVVAVVVVVVAAATPVMVVAGEVVEMMKNTNRIKTAGNEMYNSNEF
jgi:hypothetical protein